MAEILARIQNRGFRWPNGHDFWANRKGGKMAPKIAALRAEKVPKRGQNPGLGWVHLECSFREGSADDNRSILGSFFRTWDFGGNFGPDPESRIPGTRIFVTGWSPFLGKSGGCKNGVQNRSPSGAERSKKGIKAWTGSTRPK